MKKFFAIIAVAVLLFTQLATPVFACEPLTQGYWKNHLCEWRNNYQTTVFDCNNGKYYWTDVINTPTNGDAWYILAHQYIAFQLNIANYAYDCGQYTQTLSEAQTLLKYGPGNIPVDLRASAIELAEMLDGLNNQ